MRILGLSLKGNVSDAKTVWPYSDQWADAGAAEDLFDDFEGYLKAEGYLAMGGLVINAYIVCSVGSKASFDKHWNISQKQGPDQPYSSSRSPQ